MGGGLPRPHEEIDLISINPGQQPNPLTRRNSLMKALKITSITLYSFSAIIIGTLGLRFITATQYFSYHAQAAATQWSTIDPNLQFVYLAVFKLCGAALISLCIALLTMIIVPFSKHDHRWSHFAIPLIGFLFWSITFAITLYVTHTTPAKAPWDGSLICVTAILLGFASSLLERSLKKR